MLNYREKKCYPKYANPTLCMWRDIIILWHCNNWIVHNSGCWLYLWLCSSLKFLSWGIFNSPANNWLAGELNILWDIKSMRYHSKLVTTLLRTGILFPMWDTALSVVHVSEWAINKGISFTTCTSSMQGMVATFTQIADLLVARGDWMPSTVSESWEWPFFV